MVNVFPAGQREVICYSLGSSLEAVFTQHLLPCPSEKCRVLACEVMLGTPGVKNTVREGQVQKLHSEMQMGRKLGMKPLDHVLLELYQDGLISYDCCLNHARVPRTIKDKPHGGNNIV